MRRLRLHQPPHIGFVVELAVAGPIGRWFRRRNWAGVTLPLPFVTLIVYWGQGNPDPLMRVHEWAHVEQNGRDLFWLASWIRYAWQLARVLRWRQMLRRPRQAMMNAYHEHPAEREAYEVQLRAWEGGLPPWSW